MSFKRKLEVEILKYSTDENTEEKNGFREKKRREVMLSYVVYLKSLRWLPGLTV